MERIVSLPQIAHDILRIIVCNCLLGDFIPVAKTFIYILTFKLTHDRLQRFAYSSPTTKWEQSLVGKA